MDDIQVTVADCVRLMTDFRDGRIDVNAYRSTIFSLFTKRMEPLDEDTSRVLQLAYHDADDFDATIRLPYTFQEPELRERVKRSLDELASLGHKPTPDGRPSLNKGLD